MSSRGRTDDTTSSQQALVDCEVVIAEDRTAKAGSDGPSPKRTERVRRNALTSIYWVPTIKSPVQPLTQNQSDHVHYYQGGLPFTYHTYCPTTRVLETKTLGPDILSGQHVLQIPVASGTWKCGHLVTEQKEQDDSEPFEYCIVAEAVGPGFDFRDFRFVGKDEVADAANVPDPDVQKLLLQYVQGQTAAGTHLSMQEIDEHYESGKKHSKNIAEDERAKERM